MALSHKFWVEKNSLMFKLALIWTKCRTTYDNFMIKHGMNRINNFNNIFNQTQKMHWTNMLDMHPLNLKIRYFLSFRSQLLFSYLFFSLITIWYKVVPFCNNFVQFPGDFWHIFEIHIYFSHHFRLMVLFTLKTSPNLINEESRKSSHSVNEYCHGMRK